jgi:hypothetical protein
MALITTNNLSDADASYALLIRTHDGLTDAESHALNARLVLILMNQVGDAATIAEALALARATGAGGQSG